MRRESVDAVQSMRCTGIQAGYFRHKLTAAKPSHGSTLLASARGTLLVIC
jgi:hypothetical protein